MILYSINADADRGFFEIEKVRKEEKSINPIAELKDQEISALKHSNRYFHINSSFYKFISVLIYI